MKTAKLLPIFLLLVLLALPLAYSEPIGYGKLVEPSNPFLSFVISPTTAPNGANCDSSIDNSKRFPSTSDVMSLGAICASTSRVIAYFCNDNSCSNRNLIADKFRLDGALPIFNVGTGNDIFYECYNCEGSTQTTCSKSGESLYINNNIIAKDKCSNPTFSVVPSAYKTIYLCNAATPPSDAILVGSFDGYKQYIRQDSSCGTQLCPLEYCPNGEEMPYDSKCNPLPCPDQLCVRDGKSYKIGDTIYQACSTDKKSSIKGVVVNVDNNECQVDHKTSECSNTCAYNGVCDNALPTGCTKKDEATEEGKPCCNGLVKHKGLLGLGFERCGSINNTNCVKEGDRKIINSCCTPLVVNLNGYCVQPTECGIQETKEKCESTTDPATRQCYWTGSGCAKGGFQKSRTLEEYSKLQRDALRDSLCRDTFYCAPREGFTISCVENEETVAYVEKARSGRSILQFFSDNLGQGAFGTKDGLCVAVAEEQDDDSELSNAFTKFVNSLGSSVNKAFGGKSKTGLDDSTLGWLIIVAIAIIAIISFSGKK